MQVILIVHKFAAFFEIKTIFGMVLHNVTECCILLPAFGESFGISQNVAAISQESAVYCWNVGNFSKSAPCAFFLPFFQASLRCGLSENFVCLFAGALLLARVTL